MQIAKGIRIPTPFGGSIKTPAIETPPMSLPAKPDAHGRKALGLALGKDAAMVVGLIPYVGEIPQAMLEDMHEGEILSNLSADEFRTYVEYNKVFPSTVAMARTILFPKEVETAEQPAKIPGILPMPPQDGPPLPRMLNIYWPGAKAKA